MTAPPTHDVDDAVSACLRDATRYVSETATIPAHRAVLEPVSETVFILRRLSIELGQHLGLELESLTTMSHDL
jgi:hypothetical protein